MIALGTTLFGLEIPSAGPVFAAALVVHVLAGMTAVATGAVAIFARKAPGRHPRCGTSYVRGPAVVFGTATIMAGIRWEEDRHLFFIGAVAFTTATVGSLARRYRWRGWLTCHIPGMGLSYVALLTAFSIDNGPQLPLWNRLPAIAFWVGPSLIGTPLIVLALARNRPRARTDRAAGTPRGGTDQAASAPRTVEDSR
jgi:hypothetical protein